jgi:IS5 family transposase
MSFQHYVLKEQYKRVSGLGDRLELMKNQIDWEPFIPLVKSVYRDSPETGGRPHTDEVLVVRCMLLQSWYGLSDPELEYQINDRLSFRNFLGFPEEVPDFTTVWKARERLKSAGVDVKIWAELQRQLVRKGYEVKKGVIQDASFIEADVGKKRYCKEKRAEKKGEKIEHTKKQEQHIDRDGSFAVKNQQIHYGYKSHLKTDADYRLIRDYAVTTARLHDGDVDLVREGDVAAYRDKGYFGKRLHACGVQDKTMKRGTRAGKLNGGEQRYNKAISRVRAPGERPFSVVKRVFNGTRTFVKTIRRVSIKEMFKCFAYNLYQLVTLERIRLAVAG